MLPDEDAVDFSDIEVSDEEGQPAPDVPGSAAVTRDVAFGQEAPVSGATASPAAHEGAQASLPSSAAPLIPAPPAAEPDAAGAAGAATAPETAADAPLVSLETYLELADEQAALEAPDAQPLPAAELPQAEPPAFEAPPAPPPVLHSAGVVSMAHDDAAEAIMRDVYGIEVPAAQQGRVVMDVVSFSESLMPREWFPRQRLAACTPPDRRALVCSRIIEPRTAGPAAMHTVFCPLRGICTNTDGAPVFVRGPCLRETRGGMSVVSVRAAASAPS